MRDERAGDLETRHAAQRDHGLTTRERQDWQDVEVLLAEIARLGALLADVVADCPADCRGVALDAARAYLGGGPPDRTGRPGVGGRREHAGEHDQCTAARRRNRKLRDRARRAGERRPRPPSPQVVGL